MAEPVYGFTSKQVRDKLSAFARTLSAPFTNAIELITAPPQQTRIFKATVKTTISAAIGGKAGHNYKVGEGDVYLLRKEGLQLKFWFHTDTNLKLERRVYNSCPIVYAVDENAVLDIEQDRWGDYWVTKICEAGSFSSSNSSSAPSSTNSSCQSSSSPSSTQSPSVSQTSSSSTACECIWLWSAFTGPPGTEFWSILKDNCNICQQICVGEPAFDGSFDGETFPGQCVDPPVSSVSQSVEQSISKSSISSGDDCGCSWTWSVSANDWSITSDNCSDCVLICDPLSKPEFPGSFDGEDFPGACIGPD